MRAGRLTSRTLVEQSLEAVGRHDARLQAVVHLMAEEALAAAAARDAEAAAGRWRGPLHGIPVTVKDVIDVAGVPTRAGSAAFCTTPSEDAASVTLLRRAGAVVLAKVSTHEFALGVTCPQSRNPHDPTRIPGGSSGGSAIAVAVGMGLGSLATDTRASTRVPAALCGVVGLKPTFGAVPTRGVLPLSWTMDHVGQIARTVQDAALLLSAVASPACDWAPAVAGPTDCLRVGIPRAAFEALEDGVAAGVDDALEGLERLGCAVADAARPTEADLDATNVAALLISRCEAAAFHRHLGTDRSLYWDEVADQLDAADGIAAVDYIDAQRLRADLQDAFAAVFEDHDVLAMPTTPCVAPPSKDFARYLLALSRNTSPWSLTGFPALTVPCGTTGGLPFGLQLVAPPWHEGRLIALGAALEGALASPRSPIARAR
jgi:aspartyl-tRNA(Asn)/glutamyl-tRNA(Gln) amidotransferase subunit A